MSAVNLNTPQHWRQRAAEMRALAEDVTNGEARAKLLKLAAEYDRLADRAAKRPDRPAA